MRKIKLTESQIKKVINTLLESDLNEYGKAGLYKKSWTEQDQIIAFYLTKFGESRFERVTGYNKHSVAEEVIGTSVDSLVHQMGNFKSLMGDAGFDRPHKIQSKVFNQYNSLSNKEMDDVVKEAILNNTSDPDRLNKYLASKEIKKIRDEMDSERGANLKAIGRNPKRMTMIGARLKHEIPNDQPDINIEEPNDQPDINIEEPTSDTIKFLKSVLGIIDDAKNNNDMSKLDQVKEELEFMIEYMTSELDTTKMVAEMRKRILKRKLS